MVHIYNGVLLSYKKNEIMPSAATRMDLDTLSQSEKDKYDITDTWTQKNDTKELIYKTDSQMQEKGMITKREEDGGTNEKFGINKYTLCVYKRDKK